MGRELNIRRVTLGGADTPHAWEFPQGVTVIAGDSGGGKTSLLNLIKYGLGGGAPITSKLSEAADSVTVEASFGGRVLHLTRHFASRKSIVDVSEGDEVLGEFSTDRGNKRPWLSNLLLESIGIPSVRVPQSRSGRSNKLTSISFQDVFAYCYLDQEQIDRSTVFDNESYARGAKRPWTFELLFGLIDSTLAEMEAKKVELAAEKEVRQEQLTAVESFAEAKRLPASASELAERVGTIDLDLARLGDELTGQEQELKVALAGVTTLQDGATASSERLTGALAERRRIRLELSEVRRVGNQLERDLAVAREGEAAKAVLEPLSYEVCPRCEQSLGTRTTAAGHCVVCQQPESADSAQDDEMAARRIAEQLEETRRLTEQLENAESEAGRVIEQLRGEVATEREAFSRANDEASLPFRQRVIELQDQLGALRGERRTLTAGIPFEAALVSEREEIAATDPQIAELGDNAARRREELQGARKRVEELSTNFDEILRRFTLPWLESAEVDPNSYLPVVNGLSLRELSSGGMKTTTNVAYYLAVFVTALRDAEVFSPSFLMLDSIRKDSGTGKDDLARSDKIYGYLQTLQELRKPPKPLPRDFQLIVVDNDMPQGFEGQFNTIQIDLQNPLIHS